MIASPSSDIRGLEDPEINLYKDISVRSDDLYALAKYSIVIGILEKHPHRSILNVGCGSGELCFLLAERGHTVLGIDPSPEYVEIANRSLKRKPGLHCSFSVSSIEEFQAAEPFDGIVACDVLEHIPDDRAAVEKMSKLVRPGGSIVMTLPAGRWLYGFHDRHLGHIRRYTRRSVLSLLDGVFEIRSIRRFGITLMPVLFFYNRIINKQLPVSKWGSLKANPLSRRVLALLLGIDKKISLPLGTSIIVEGVAK